jgi:hypothetical protein
MIPPKKPRTARLSLAALAFATTEGFMLLDALGCDTIIANALKGLRIREASR